MATPSNKVLIVETNGSELPYQTELLLAAVNILFDNSTNGFTSDGVQGALEEIASLLFSTQYITSGKTINIPVTQQMLLYQFIDIDDGGSLDIHGEVAIL